jgi:uncharacterized membrane protein (UPF0127 family)
MRRVWLLAALLACTATAAAQEINPDGDLNAAFAKDVLIIEASAFACYRFDIYLAVEREQTQRGLMFVREMPLMTGMLFVYDRDSVYSMWMKNTLIPLDMVFVRSNGEVSSIIRNTEPHSLQSQGSTEAVRYVLELNAGVTERFSIDSDSRLIWGPMQDND